MFAGVRRSGDWRRCAVFLSLFAILVRAAIPAGWMPAAAEGSLIVLCTAEGAREIYLGYDGKPIAHDERPDATHRSAPCVFAAVAQFAAPPENTAVAPPAAVSEAVYFAETEELFHERNLTPRQARAPPTLS